MKNPHAYAILKAIGQVASRSLFDFNKRIIGYDAIDETVHRGMCDHIERPRKAEGVDYAMLLEPRGVMKTSFALIGASVWILANDPNQRILIISANVDKAKQRLKSIKAVMEGCNRLKFFYSDMASFGRSKATVSSLWTADKITVAGRTATYHEASVMCAGRGLDVTGGHWDWIFPDDIEDRSTVDSEVEQVNTFDYFLSLAPCVNPKCANMRLIQTRWGFDDLPSKILGEEEEYKGRFDFVRCRVISARNEDGTARYPKILPEEELEKQLKILGPYLFSCLYLQDPSAPEGQIFPVNHTMLWWGRYEREGTASYLYIDKVQKKGDNDYVWREEEKIQVRLFVLVDPALGEDTHACDSAIVVVGKEIDKNRLWIIDASKVKSKDPYILTDTIMHLCVKYPPLAVVIEDHAFQLVLKSFFETEARKTHVNARVETVGRNDHRSKQERILGLQPLWLSDSVMIRVMPEYFDMLDNPLKRLRNQLYNFRIPLPKQQRIDFADALSRVLDIDWAGTRDKSMVKNIDRIVGDYIAGYKGVKNEVYDKITRVGGNLKRYFE